MSSRAVRRLIQQTEGQAVDTEQCQEPNGLNNHVESESRSPTFTKGNLFSSFGCDFFANGVHCEADEQSSESSVSVCQTEKQSASKKKKKRKKKPACKPQQRGMSENDDDWLTEAKTIDICSSGDTKDSECVSMSSLLSTNSRELDHNAELNRLFVDPTFGASNVRAGRNSAARSTMKRGILVPVKVTWPPVVRFGLDMIKNNHEDSTTFNFSHSKEYQNKQALFYAAVASMNPDNIATVLADCPYHIDSLLQLSEVVIQQDNTEIGIDLLERALHAFQSAFHPAFNPTLGTYHLDYRHQTNRGLFVALFRYINVIGNRSCYRTALEYSKLLLSLNPDDDPLAVLLMLDYYAICSHQFNFLIELYEFCKDTKNLKLLPNFAFSLPLARFLKHSNHQQQQATPSSSSVALPVRRQRGKSGKQAGQEDDQGVSLADTELQDALIMFPGLLPRLLKHANFGGGTGNLDKSVLFGKEVMREPANLRVLLDLYVTRTRLLWSSPKVKPWLERNVEVVLGLVEPVKPPTMEVARWGSIVDPRLASYSSKRSVFNRPLPRNILRHLLLLDLPEVRPQMPNETAQPWQNFSFDPLPPNDSVNLYNPDLRSLSFGEQNANQGDYDTAGGILSAFLHSLLPGYAPGVRYQEQGQEGVPQAVIERLVASIRRLLEAPRAPDPGEDEG